MSDEEQVLVIKRSDLNSAGKFEGFLPARPLYLFGLLDSQNFSFVSRGVCEKDPAWKQLVPYVLITTGEKIFHYYRGRAGEEGRLHDHRSIGVGGHINREDAAEITESSLMRFSSKGTYDRGVLRELQEEVNLDWDKVREFRIIGLLNDESTEVGRVHLGILHLLYISDESAVRVEEDDIEKSGFADYGELLADYESFEKWSQLALDNLLKALLFPQTLTLADVEQSRSMRAPLP